MVSSTKRKSIHDKTAQYRTWEHTESDRSVLRVSGEIMHRGESKGRIVIILVSSSVKLPKTQNNIIFYLRRNEGRGQVAGPGPAWRGRGAASWSARHCGQNKILHD